MRHKYSSEGKGEYIHKRAIQGKINDEFVTIGDINCTLRSCENNASGPYDVQYEHKMQLSDADLSCIVRDFNERIQVSNVPEDWLDNYLKQDPNPEWDPSQFRSYIIITLQNVFDKLL